MSLLPPRVECGSACWWTVRDVWLVHRDTHGRDQIPSAGGRYGQEEIHRFFPLHRTEHTHWGAGCSLQRPGPQLHTGLPCQHVRVRHVRGGCAPPPTENLNLKAGLFIRCRMDWNREQLLVREQIWTRAALMNPTLSLKTWVMGFYFNYAIFHD